ncbi:Flagellar basal-body P-ring formation protein FlgA [Methylophaga frappieri]|uniref:Flagella basal body P-ring formation protein FlgA n=1 Tax=Methylophaga frappieri (strain ATCC BAA-2434 / DSM 25690 / JAM7) TaxID=754477 RepID=I1YI60_METFJ|nr:flagellar basal body P-ring formation chaperone FlgA [Methylophaga frappieri]AFJ02603.1 Flagellar basal-body P-ring formation protein FlgA [Methylophaga frappieri]
MVKQFFCTATLYAMFLTLPVNAADLHELNAIEHAAYLFALNDAQSRWNNPVVSVDSLDKRLRLQRCDSDLETFTNNDQLRSGKLTVGVRCHQPVAWTVYVPATIEVMRAVAVTTRPLSADHIMTADDVKLANQNILTMRSGYSTDMQSLIGQQLKSPLAMGAVLSKRQFKPQHLVQKGQLITLVSAVGNMEVRVKGEAMADAEMGQRVRVKNTRSERIVEGVVDAAGVVRVGTL